MNKNTNKTGTSEEITSKLESLERSYNLKLSEFKENLDKKYEKEKYYILGENELNNFIKSIKDDIIPATYNFFDSNLYGKYGVSNKKFTRIWLPNNDRGLIEKEAKSKKYDKMINITLGFLDFYDKYNFNNVVFAKNDKIFKSEIRVEGIYNSSRSVYFYVKELKPLSLSKNKI